MEQTKINKINKIIAEFMGAKQDSYKRWYYNTHINGVYYLGETVKDFKYNLSWDWIMPVVLKIDDLEQNDNREIFYDYDDTFNNYTTDINIFRMSIMNDIEKVYLAVGNFIMWYNQNK